MSIEVEALLRASIAAATFSINTYMAVLAGTKRSPVARSHLAAAKLLGVNPTYLSRLIRHLSLKAPLKQEQG